MKTILITGADGLIGQELCKKINKSYIIKKIDNKFPITSSSYGDILIPETLQEFIKDCDGVVHLAAISRVIFGEKYPQRCWETNVNGTYNILNLAYQSNKKPWVLYASSREVYGQQKTFPVKESAILKPLNIYANSKLSAEKIIEKYKKKGLQTAILRFSNVYGRTNDYPDRVVPAFCLSAVYGTSIHIEGETNIFDFTHISDVVEAISKVINLLEKRKEIPIMHITSGTPVSLKKLAELIQKYSKYKIKIIIDPPRSFDVSKFYGDTSLINKVLQWYPKIDLQTGIKLLIKDFIEQSNSGKKDNK
ncbi:MAG: NAD-dependent epimerase/dehydratase family protein (plasmid) [Arsenophonus sp.]|nr:MAG: NAD-dependent epimerase/dehydratase family protein [Arsenophonus sp.]